MLITIQNTAHFPRDEPRVGCDQTPVSVIPGAYDRPMKILIACFAWMPLSVAAADYVEAVRAAQITSLENTYPVWSPDGSGAVQLTRNDAYDGTPVWTPDGRFVVFASERDGNLEVYRMRAAGSEQTDPATFALGTMTPIRSCRPTGHSCSGGASRRPAASPSRAEIRRCSE